MPFADNATASPRRDSMSPIPESLDPGETMAPVAFGNLLDLARLRLGGASAETCDACNTINPVHALSCKCCAHKLPAFHARMRRGIGGGMMNAMLMCRKALAEAERAWTATNAVLSLMGRSPWVAPRARPGFARGMAATGPRK
ncbi:hypothetical protein WKW79_03560 [Variovorax robiniae]|uniref:Uncharacterized protein n=1 Tax=Variovorax robiniae TaxID=1836199 RepID=A0ABU8X4K8_9BURK